MGQWADMLLPTQAPSQTPIPQGRKWSEELLGTGQGTAPETKPKAQESWGEWAYNTVAGRKDPAYEGVPEYVPDTREGLVGQSQAKLAGQGDEAYADMLKSQLGERFIRMEKDANGYPVIVYRDQQGNKAKGYVNKPGLDMQDVDRAISGAIPYVASASVAGKLTKGAGIGVQALTQGVTAAGTSAATDVAASTMGSEQGIDPAKAGMMGAFGLAGPVASAVGGKLWREFVTIPGLVDSKTGQLTARGLEAAHKAGIEPEDLNADLSKAFARALADSGDPAQAATKAGTEQFGISATRGQVTKDPYLLTQEEGMRRRLYGEKAQDTMRAFDDTQKREISEAALGQESFTSTPGKPGIGEMIAPGRQPGRATDRRPAALGQTVQDAGRAARQGAREAESAAWEGTRNLEATEDAFKILPNMLDRSLRSSEVIVDPQLHPAATAMAKDLEKFVAGEAPEAVSSVLRQSKVTGIDQMRRRMLRFYKSAATPEDERAAKAIYDGVNDWIGEAAALRLLKGDPEAAMKIATARGFTKEVRDIFEPKAADGRLAPAGQRLKKILDPARTDSGEAVIQALFGAQGSRTANEGTVQALRNLKTALDRFAPADQGKQAWDDIRLAFWVRTVTDKGGEMLGPQAIVGNLKSALNNQRSVMQTLYSPDEIRTMRQFLRAIEDVAYKPPNASGSGYTAASFMKEGLLKLLDAFGIGHVARGALKMTPLEDAYGAVQAQRAVNSLARPRRPNATPAVTGTGQAYERSQD